MRILLLLLLYAGALLVLFMIWQGRTKARKKLVAWQKCPRCRCRTMEIRLYAMTVGDGFVRLGKCFECNAESRQVVANRRTQAK